MCFRIEQEMLRGLSCRHCWGASFSYRQGMFEKHKWRGGQPGSLSRSEGDLVVMEKNHLGMRLQVAS